MILNIFGHSNILTLCVGKQRPGAQLGADPLRRADADRPPGQNPAAQLLPVRPPAGFLQEGCAAPRPAALPGTAGHGPDAGVGRGRRPRPGPGYHPEERPAPAQRLNPGVHVHPVLQEGRGQAAVGGGFRQGEEPCEGGPGNG